MAETRAEIKNAYPLPVYNYRVNIGTDAVAFSEVSGLSIGYETTTYKESPGKDGPKAGPRVLHMPAQSTAPTVSLKKGLIKSESLPALYEWIKTTQLNQVEKKDISISLLDEQGDPVITWMVLNAFPTKLDAPSFTADSNDVAIESMELMADVVTIEVE